MFRSRDAPDLAGYPANPKDEYRKSGKAGYRISVEAGYRISVEAGYRISGGIFSSKFECLIKS
jgi:hypothetical protein